MTALLVATHDNVYDYMTAACDDTYARKSGALTLLTTQVIRRSRKMRLR
jgi:hypothetical protein